MKAIDIYLQNVRIGKARKFVRQGDTVLDIGSHDGVMFEQFGDWMSRGIGVDPSLEKKIDKNNYTLIPGYFPDVFSEEIKFDVITMLAVLEHIPPEKQIQLAKDCARFLNPKGRVIITVPSPQVDFILDVLTTLRIIDGMAIHEHYGFKPKDTLKIFSAPDFKLLHREIFQFGLKNFFVFEKL